MPQLRHANTLDADGRLVIFWFVIGAETLDLYLGTAPGANKHTVTTLIDALRQLAASSDGLEIHKSPRGDNWTHLWGRRFLNEKQFAQIERSKVFELIDQSWHSFVNADLPKIISAIHAVTPRS